jgi:peptidyl-prolyl cis-trans isomerase D
MATLEKIRNKSGLLIVVIGVALFAFIIGDFLNSSSSIMSNRAIAEVGGTEIDVMDFQNRYDKVAQQYQQQNTKQDYAALQQQVLNQMMQETIINEELEALGINVTDKELSAAMLGEKAIPQMVQFANQFGCQTPDQLHEMIFNPGKYGIPAEQAAEFQNMWLEQEKQIDQNLRYQKFANLLGAIKANNLDAKAMYEENAATAKIAYVKKDFSSLNNDEFPVSTSEIKNKWSE